jgi:hypothetical protein
MNSTTTALRLGLASALSACLVVPLTATAHATDSTATSAEAMRGRAGHTIAASPLRRADGTDAPKPARAAPQRLAAAAVSQDCDGQLVQAAPLADRTVVKAQVDGAATVTLERQRDGGTWRAVGTQSGSTVVFDDLGTNPLGFRTYRLTARNTDGTIRQQCSLNGNFSQTTNDGWGEGDFVTAGAGPLHQQARGVNVEAATGTWVTPAYSTDGQLLAATRIDPGTGAGILEVRLARTGAVQFSVDLGADISVADPAFSPDGQTLAFSGYDTTSGDPLGIGFVPVNGAHTPQLLDTDVPVVEPAWMPDSTTLVVTAFDAAGGLSTVCRTCQQTTPLSGTAGGYTPEVAADGTVYFTVDDGTTSSLRRRTAGGSVATLRTSTADVYSQPRLAPDLSLYVSRLARSTDTVPNAQNFMVRVSPTGAAYDQEYGTSIWGDVGFGFDVRQPKSKGTSDYAGDANPDILGKDSAGTLWAYYSSGTTPVAGRVSMGGGWNMFNQVVAAGDLNGDNRADVLGRKADGTLWLYHGLGGGKVRPGVQVGSGWSSYVLVAPGDFNGDGRADLLGRDSAMVLWLYPGKGNGTFGARSKVTSGWGGFSAIIGFGDFNFDGKADILGRERSTGYLYLYPGTGTGGITGRTRLGAGWNTINAFAAPEFRLGQPGLFGRRADGSLRFYPVSGDGAFSSWTSAGSGWSGFQITG